MTIVSKNGLQMMLEDASAEKRSHIVGRACVVLFDRQTKDEKVTNTTNNHNNVGFTGADARSGSLTAKYYLKHKKLLEWQVERWMKMQKSGYARLCKYHKQLNEAAAAKAAKAHMIKRMKEEG